MATNGTTTKQTAAGTAALSHPGHPCSCTNPLCTNGLRCPWRIVSCQRSVANGGVFVAEIHMGAAWVARIKHPDESAGQFSTTEFAEAVCAAMNEAEARRVREAGT